MALGRIIRDKNFVYINGQTLYDVESLNASFSANNSPLRVAGHGSVGLVSQGILQGQMSLQRLSINDDPFTGLDIFPVPFSGVFRYIDSTDQERHFTMHSGYVSNYSFSAQVQDIPRITTDIIAYGNMVGGTGIPTGNITTDADGFLDNYVFPRGINLNFSDGETNRVQSFDYSISVNRSARSRLGQVNSIPDNFVSYPIEVSVSIEIDVDEYSAPKIDNLICRDREDISLELLNCEGSGIRSFVMESGTLQSVDMTASADGSSNKATLNYIKNVNDIFQIQSLFGGE